MRRWQRTAKVFLLSVAALLLAASSGVCCPLCTRADTCFTYETDRSDITMVGKKNDSGIFQISTVIKGSELIDPDTLKELEVPVGQDCIVFGRVKTDTATGAKNIAWFHHFPLSIYGTDYLRRTINLTATGSDRLAQLLPFLKSPDLFVADDAFFQIARSSYPDLKNLGDSLDREFVISFFNDAQSVQEVRSLAMKLLGTCGSADDAKYAREIIDRPDAAFVRGLDVAIVTYLSLQKTDALQDITQRFVAKDDVPRSIKIAIIRAIQFHLHFEKLIQKSDLLAILKQFVTDPDMFDLVLPELTQAEDWSVINEVTEIFKSNKQRLIRVAAAEYLLACPDDSAKQQLAALREIDNDAIIQAETGETHISAVPVSTNESSFLTALLASRFASPALVTTTISIAIVAVAVFFLKRMRR